MTNFYALLMMWMLAADQTIGRSIKGLQGATDCPVRYRGNCFKMFKSNSAFTKLSGELFCSTLTIDEVPQSGHLADVYNKIHFNMLTRYILSEEPNKDPNVLLGMTFNAKSGVTRFHDGSVSNFMWQWYARPLAWGKNMVIRASKIRAKSTRMQNVGDELHRYNRILCQYLDK